MSDIIFEPLAVHEVRQRRELPVTRTRSVIASSVLAIAVLFSALVVLPGVAAGTSPKLTITPSTIFYPCNEGNVTFAVKHFGADKTVKLHSGSATGPKVAVITTNASGKGRTVLDFTNTMPGSYPYYAVEGGLSANATLTVGTCP
jgi:hypothetical protein